MPELISESIDSCLNLVDLLRHRAKHQPNQIAYRFLKNGEIEDSHLTYRELDLKARAIASHLQSQKLSGSRIVLIYPYEAGLEFIIAFFACLYAGSVAVPCHPPLSRHAFPDLQARIKQSQSNGIMTSNALINKIKNKLIASDQFWVITDNIAAAIADQWIEPDIQPNSLAFLQYTSGSTGIPKGVMTTHECVLYNQRMLKLSFQTTKKSIGVSWLPLFHDMGLMGSVIQALYVGGLSVLMSPMAFIQQPVRWLQVISHYQATISGAPNFAYDLLCRYVTDEQRKVLDLSRWEVAFSGAEPIQIRTVERFSDLFNSCGFKRTAFYPCYGMAESVLLITGGEVAQPPVINYINKAALEENRVLTNPKEKSGFYPIVGCGRTWLDGKLAIIDPQSLTRCPIDKIGEIWVSGSGLGIGYWDDVAKTEKTFQAYTEDTGEGPFLRTGDLGFLQDGELFVTGRLNDIMVFWGLNHYPQLIEETIEACHPALRHNCTAAFSVEIEGESRLVIAQEIERSYRNSFNIDEIAEVIRWAVFDKHFVDIYALVLLKPGSIPKTSSGKIQRHVCRTKFIENSLDAIAQWQCPPNQIIDITAVIKRYLNPFVHLRRYKMILQSRLKRIIYKSRT